MENNLKNIMVVKLSAIGDVIHALPVSYAIKETFPESKLTWVVEPPAYDILKMNPYIDKIIVFHKKEFRSFSGFIKQFFPFKDEIQKEQYDAVLDLQGLFKSAAIAFFAKSNIKLGVCNMREMSGQVSKPVVGKHAHGHIVERYLDTAHAIGCKVEKVVFPIEILQDDSDEANEIMVRAGAKLNNPYVVFAVGANWPNKRWTTEAFALLNDWFYDMKVVPIMVGNGPVDEQRAQEIESMIEIPPINLVNKTNWAQLAHIVKYSRITIGGDTGVLHLAAALGTRTVMLMGPTDSKRNGPYGQLENAIEVNRDCKGCWKRVCPKKLDCLEKITASQVESLIISMR